MTEKLTPLELEKGAELLLRGEVVAFPTETVYGLGAPVFNPIAIQRLYQVKGRPSDNPLIAHLSDVDQVTRLALEIPDEFYRLAKAFFPGPLTVVLKKKHPDVPFLVSAGLQSIALRMPKHPLAQKLIAMVGEPLVAPSANLSGTPSATCADHVLNDFEGKIAAVIDGGTCSLGIESTVVSLIDCNRPVLLRPGNISLEELEEVLKQRVLLFDKKDPSHQEVVSPGMKYRHYAPKAPLRLFTTWKEISLYVQKNSPQRRMVLSSLPSTHAFQGCDFFPLSNKELYANLRLADQKHYNEILVYCDEDVLNNAALMNRLNKASTSNSS